MRVLCEFMIGGWLMALYIDDGHVGVQRKGQIITLYRAGVNGLKSNGEYYELVRVKGSGLIYFLAHSVWYCKNMHKLPYNLRSSFGLHSEIERHAMINYSFDENEIY